jgi:putative transposase
VDHVDHDDGRHGSCAVGGMRTNQPGHLNSFDYLGLHRYFLTFCTDYRQPVFQNAGVVSLALSQIVRAAKEEAFVILAYCFMPDHVHLLIEAMHDTSDCRRFIKSAKQYSGFHFQKQFKQKLWQRYGFERVLRDDEATLVVARYILNNPLRAGLAGDPCDYPFVGSDRYSVEEILEAVGEIDFTNSWST